MLAFIGRLFAAAVAQIVITVVRIGSLFRVRSNKAFNKMKRYKWHKIPLGKPSICSDGSKYCMYMNRGISNNLLIYFSGGGLAWDAESAHNPMAVSSYLKGNGLGYYIKSIPAFGLHPMKGILDNTRSENPCKDWNVAYIPYTSGDFHIGNSTRRIEYKGKTKTIYFNGFNNVLTAFDEIFSVFKSPDKIMVCGESAGAFGSSFYVKDIAQHYADSHIVYLCDSAHMRYEKWKDALEMWGVDCKDAFGFEPGADIAKASLAHNSQLLGDRVVQLNTNMRYDSILSEFSAKLSNTDQTDNQHLEVWSQTMYSVVRELDKQIPNFYYFIVNNDIGTSHKRSDHVISRQEKFYQYTEEGVAFYEWVADALHGKYCSIGGSSI